MSHLSKPRLIVVSGPNGSGKTSITEKLLRHQWMQNCEYINPDYIARDLYGDWNSQEAIIRAANKSEEIRENCLKEEKNIAFETVKLKSGLTILVTNKIPPPKTSSPNILTIKELSQ